MTTHSLNRPIPFQGTPEQAAANRATHDFVMVERDEPPRCMNCDCKSWHKAADYPCMTSVPRETVTFHDDGTTTVAPDGYDDEVI